MIPSVTEALPVLSRFSIVSGVPDSLMSEIVEVFSQSKGHITASNEGGAIGLAVGSYLGTRVPGLVYMQNSGLGNAVNPLISLAGEEVLGVPMVLVIGLRGVLDPGDPSFKDEPQHLHQGRITENLLDMLAVSYRKLPLDSSWGELDSELALLRDLSIKNSAPVALVVPRGASPTLISSESKIGQRPSDNLAITMDSAVEQILSHFTDSLVVASTGYISRHALKNLSAVERRDSLLMVSGAMGHTSQVAVGLSRANPERHVVCLDGDGSALMHLGSLATLRSASHLTYFILNNGRHFSVGGQPTSSPNAKLAQAANSISGIDEWFECSELAELERCLAKIRQKKITSIIEVKLVEDDRSALPRPSESPKSMRSNFMKKLGI